MMVKRFRHWISFDYIGLYVSNVIFHVDWSLTCFVYELLMANSKSLLVKGFINVQKHLFVRLVNWVFTSEKKNWSAMGLH